MFYRRHFFKKYVEFHSMKFWLKHSCIKDSGASRTVFFSLLPLRCSQHTMFVHAVCINTVATWILFAKVSSLCELSGVRTILMCSKTLASRRHESGGRRVDHHSSRRVFRRYLVEIATGLPGVLTYAFLGFVDILPHPCKSFQIYHLWSQSCRYFSRFVHPAVQIGL